jgi:hypothetical protein
VGGTGVSGSGEGVDEGVGVSVGAAAWVAAKIASAVAVSNPGSGVGEGVMGVHVGRAVHVGRITQETGAWVTLSKVGAGVRVGAGPGLSCSANSERAKLKMI